ncbi:hypothetical protein BN1708_004424 [Verticillium longisporum]|uniref:poly(A)-specific ribonuclease n=1 Tax=Verticillium longisporum TaxID=100787 RepID=A0A0G4M117_VERLO|nr:hypothetical protein BN1708_004424 [Verticillium longisporum]
MPPPPLRYPGGPNTIPPSYHQQFSSHAQGHGAAHGPPLGGNPSYLNANSQSSPFSIGGNVLGGVGALNGGFGVGADTGGLGSHAARMGFQQAANIHQQQQHGQGQHGFGADHGGANMRGGHNKGRIREVWKHNLHEEMAVLRDLVDKYPYIAMDTEFPGIVSRPMGGFRGKSDYHYQCLRTNVDMLKVIQIGLALFNEEGETPPARPSSADLADFGPAGWISFHGGYDFGYLTKLLDCRALPSDEVDFDRIMKLYFPSTYDVKHLMKHAIRLHNSGLLTPSDPSTSEILQKFEHKSGLENIAETLKVKRVGAAHQAGSDSLITGKVFFQMREKIFNGDIADDHVGKVWGLGIPDGGLLMGHMMGTHAGAGGAGSHEPNGQQQNGTPSTPNTVSAGLVSTPGAQSHNTNGFNTGPMTPGGGGGVFGSFAFNANR